MDTTLLEAYQPHKGDDTSHHHVRWAMYLVLVLVAGMTLFRMWRVEHVETLRKEDTAIIQALAQYDDLIHQAGSLAVLLGTADVDRITTRANLDKTRAQAHAQAKALETLLQAHSERELQSGSTLALHLRHWKQRSAQLWWHIDTIRAHAARNDTAALRATSYTLLAELNAPDAASRLLATQLDAAVEKRSQDSSRLILLQGGVALTGLLVLAFTVVEPTARRVRRQHRALSEQAKRFRRLALIAECSPNAVVVCDPMHQVEWVNPAFSKLTGKSLGQSIGQSIDTLLPAPIVALVQDHACQAEVEIVLHHGQRAMVLADARPMGDDTPHLAGWVLTLTDRTELRTQQQLLNLAVDGANIGIWQWDLQTDTTQCNDRMLAILGYERNELAMTSVAWNALVHPDDSERWLNSIKVHLQDPSVPHRISVRHKHASGRWTWLLFTGTVVDRDTHGTALRMAGVAMDVNAQKAMEQQLRTAALTDGLTQLPNRAVVVDLIDAALTRGKEQPGYHFAVLFMDFDRFKQVNDTLGHNVGDELLRQIARRLQDSLRPGDRLLKTGDFTQTAARIGGDEFVVLLDDIRGDLDAEIVAGRLLDVLAVPYQIGTAKVNSSASIGIVTTHNAVGDANGVLRDADIAMYEAKRSGRGRYVMFDPAMRQRLTADVALENDLRQALGRNELFVVYQPLVDLRNGKFAGMEALMRWRHPQRGFVSPAEFIPIAETCGLIDAMGLFVLQTACRDFAVLHKELGTAAPPSVAVNLSRAQLSQPNLVSDILNALRDSGMTVQQLVLEVTESLAAQDATVKATLHEIRTLGITLSLDDFGTGYSSLACLHELPVNFVKIDRSFVSQARDSQYHRVLIEATLRMAQTLGLGTVAEGIETMDQAHLMASMGCDKGQGYLYSKPLELDKLISWIQAQ